MKANNRTIDNEALNDMIFDHFQWLAGRGGSRLVLEGATIYNYNFCFNNLSCSIIRGCKLIECIIEGVTLTNADWTGSDIINSSMSQNKTKGFLL